MAARLHHDDLHHVLGTFDVDVGAVRASPAPCIFRDTQIRGDGILDDLRAKAEAHPMSGTPIEMRDPSVARDQHDGARHIFRIDVTLHGFMHAR